MSFWEFFWFVFTTFIFISFLIVLFQILADVFSDRELSGWGKTGWVILLLVLPALGSIIYLIARGPSMATRTMERAAARQGQADDYIRSVAGSSPTEEIARADALLKAGTISEAEFAQLKSAALGKTS